MCCSTTYIVCMATNTNTNITPEQDIERWELPVATQHAAAAAAAALGKDMALVPFFLPGKELGYWTVGQEVEIGAAMFFMNNRSDEDLRFSAARYARSEMAKDRPGTVGYFVVWADRPDGRAAAFEDCVA